MRVLTCVFWQCLLCHCLQCPGPCSTCGEWLSAKWSAFKTARRATRSEWLKTWIFAKDSNFSCGQVSLFLQSGERQGRGVPVPSFVSYIVWDFYIRLSTSDKSKQNRRLTKKELRSKLLELDRFWSVGLRQDFAAVRLYSTSDVGPVQQSWGHWMT